MSNPPTLLAINEIVSYVKSNTVLQGDEYVLVIHPQNVGLIIRWRNEQRRRRAFLRKRTGRRTP